jgi:hypothetical protein
MQCYNNSVTLHLKNVVETEFVFDFPGLPWTHGTQD